MPVVVFDFDKTLTKKDTVLGFLVTASGKNFMLARRLIFLFFAVLHKLRLIGNDRLKNTGIRIFLQGTAEEDINKRATAYAGTIQLTSIYHTEFISKNPHAIIASASYENYIRPLCRDNMILAARLAYTGGKVSGLSQNAYGVQKVKLLNEHGIAGVDIFYTDSFSDQAVMDISKVVYLVENDSIKKIKG